MRDDDLSPDAEGWLTALVEEGRPPVFDRSAMPPAAVLRRLEAAGALVRVPGDVLVVRRPGDDPDEVVRRVYWQVVRALLANYSPAVVERDSAVRILSGDATPPPLLRLRNGRNRSNFEFAVVGDLRVRGDGGSVDPARTVSHRVADADILLDDPARILLGLELRFVRDHLDLIALWMRSLVVPRPSVESAYDEFPRPVVLKRLAHLAEDVGNRQLAATLNAVVDSKQSVRIGRDRTGVGRRLIVSPRVRQLGTRRPWLDRLHFQMSVFEEQIRAVASPLEPEGPGRSLESLLSQARLAKTDDTYHSTSIEGYILRYEDVSVLLGGGPDHGSLVADVRSRMAVIGYAHAFDNLLRTLEAATGSLEVTDDFVFGLYVDLFQPSVEAGIVDPALLRGWRTTPVFIRNTRYVPPAADRVAELMAALLGHVRGRPGPLAMAILAHLMFASIHPFPDGNGRIARFLMNALLVNGGLPWVTIREGERREYFEALRAAQLGEDASPFARYIADRVALAQERFG